MAAIYRLRMILRTLKLRDFRAHENSCIELVPKINLFVGPNGAGKTNVLEAAHYLCLSKSFLATRDRYALRKGSAFFEIEGEFAGTARSEVFVRLAFAPPAGKRMFVNGAPLERLSDIVGTIPVVVFQPGAHAITSGAPDARRRYMDNILSQAKPAYLADLIVYRRVLRQRNELLGVDRRSPVDQALLAPLDHLMITTGSRIIASRLTFLDEFKTHLRKAWEHLGMQIEEPTISYQGLVAEDESGAIADVHVAFANELRRVRDRELAWGRTCAGPHRDDLMFKLDGLEVRRFASTGQHRTFGIALKLAQHFYLDSRLDETPILLFDDVFDSLDARRTTAIWELLEGPATGQSLITTADGQGLESNISGSRSRRFHVQKGRVRLVSRLPPEESR